MFNVNFVTPKRHFLAQNRIIWVIVRSNKFSLFSCRGRQEKKKGKERYKKSHKRYISPIRGEAPVNGFSLNFAHQRCVRRDRLCKFWCGKIKGFGKYDWSNFGFSHWNGWSPLQQCSLWWFMSRGQCTERYEHWQSICFISGSFHSSVGESTQLTGRWDKVG